MRASAKLDRNLGNFKDFNGLPSASSSSSEKETPVQVIDVKGEAWPRPRSCSQNATLLPATPQLLVSEFNAHLWLQVLDGA